MYEFSVSALVWGIVIMGIGTLFVKFHRPIANEFGGGVGSYEKYKLYGLIIVGIGILMMFNLPAFFFGLIADMFFGR